MSCFSSLMVGLSVICEVNLFRNIMRDNILVNPSGLPGHAMGMDLNMEHLIRYLKVS